MFGIFFLRRRFILKSLGWWVFFSKLDAERSSSPCSVCGIMWKNWSGLPLRVLGVLLNLYFLLVTGLRLENAAVRVFSALNRNSYLLSPSHSV